MLSLSSTRILHANADFKQFITLQATPLATIVALPLPLLAHNDSAIRSLPLPARRMKRNLSKPDPYADNGKGVKPAREIWTILEGLMAGGSFAWTNEESALGDILSVIEVRPAVQLTLVCLPAEDTSGVRYCTNTTRSLVENPARYTSAHTHRSSRPTHLISTATALHCRERSR